jgi:hypothetical protein
VGRRIGWALSTLLLLATGAVGVYTGLRELDGALTALQYSVTIGVLSYGIVGLAAGAAMAVRHRWSVSLAALWGIIVTYVSATAALAYAGAGATIGGAIAGGLAAALIAAGVVWSAHASSRSAPSADESGRAVRMLAVVAVLSVGAANLGGCYAYYETAPGVADRDGLRTKVVLTKREPDRLIAGDLTVCWVIPEVYAGIRPGDHWRCNWQVVPSGM